MLDTKTKAQVFSEQSYSIDQRNKRLVVEHYNLITSNTSPAQFALQLIKIAEQNNLEKIWVWARSNDVKDFETFGFRAESNLLKDPNHNPTIILTYYPHKARGHSQKSAQEDEIIKTVTSKPATSPKSMPSGTKLVLLDQSWSAAISQLLTKVFATYPTPVENPEYIRSLFQKGCIFAGALCNGKLISAASAYPDDIGGRCEMTDCATLNDYRGHSLTERLLLILEPEVRKRGSYLLYTLARAQSPAMNRTFFKLGYQYQGRLINNCDIAGNFEDMNLWVK